MSLSKLETLLTDLDRAMREGQGELRRLTKRLTAANGARKRIHPLTNTLIRLRHQEKLTPLGVEDFDLLEARVETSYDGLLIALVHAARAAGATVTTLRLEAAAGAVPEPRFAAQSLGLEISADSGPGDGLVLIADAAGLHAPAQHKGDILASATLAITLIDPTAVPEPAAAQELAASLLDVARAYGLEPVHVTGDGTQIALARVGLLTARRADGFSDPMEKWL